ncbi:hypothetical protein ACFRSX_32770 [Streptomyces goshikiensis]|uniref:hypothetical protein n=1 Tax=Streptomyces TaxID=1883 RepID=UPI000C26E088|nr:hypothetical protein [Streptomyces sp. CB02120-2]PJN14554.1 hypothetical protein CG724_33215 [Streptomyces sp. CB02120-2]
MAAPAGADATIRSHSCLRSAITEPAAYPQPAPDYRARIAERWSRESRDPRALSGQFGIAVHHNVAAPTVGAVLDLLQRSAGLAE